MKKIERLTNERIRELIDVIPDNGSAIWGMMVAGENYSVDVYQLLWEIQGLRAEIERVAPFLAVHGFGGYKILDV